MTAFTHYQNWLRSGRLSDAEVNELKDIEQNTEAIESRFGADLHFGTAGLRGIMELGTNRMNVHVVRRATQGLANYLTKLTASPTVVISYDSRLNSQAFAESTACVLAANGIRTYLFAEMMPVPLLSFAVRHLGCTAGIMITASHNPKEYNGYKVYNATGGQILDGEADAILEEIEKLDIFADVKDCSLAEAFDGTCSYVESSVYDAYIVAMDAVSDCTSQRDLSIVYTPLNGSGRRPVQDALTRSGFSFSTVAEQEAGDGNFTTCPSPNPEKEEVYDLALTYAKAQDADLIVATDPDCDRVGTMVKHDGQYVLLTGNEIGALLLEYLCQCHADSSDSLDGKFVCTSMVSTLLVDAIAASHGLEVKRTHVGFKYIGEQIEQQPESFLFGFEESNGYLVGDYARDKDGVVAAKLLCQMAAFYKAKGKTLVDLLEALYQKHGYVLDKTTTITVANQTESQQIMSVLRDGKAVAAAFDGLTEVVDYADAQAETGLPLANVIRMQFADGARLIVRPSGTEPKVKFYVSACADSKAKCQERMQEIMENLNELIGEK